MSVAQPVSQPGLAAPYGVDVGNTDTARFFVGGMSWEEIVAIVQQRRSADSLVKRQMIDIRDRIQGDYVIPLPDADGEPVLPSPAPALLMDAVDNTALRCASTSPTISVPALDPASVRSRDRAAVRRRWYHSTWQFSNFDLLMGKYYRHLIGYGVAAPVVVPDFESGRPRVEMRDALSAYPEPRAAEDTHPLHNIAFVYGRSPNWLVQQYPQTMPLISGMRGWDTLWDVVEWMDTDAIVIGVLGPRSTYDQYRSPYDDRGYTSDRYATAANSRELARYPNRAGVVPAVFSRRVTLDRAQSQVGTIVGITDLLDRLMALSVLAGEKAVFPDRYAIGAAGRPPMIVGGEWKDGRYGQTNLLVDTQAVGQLTDNKSPQVDSLLQMLERGARIGGGNPGLFGGEVGGNLRSGQTVNSLGAYSVDPRVMELQRVAASALTQLNQATTAVAKGYWPGRVYHLFSGLPGDAATVTVDVDKDLESGDNVVQYPFPGSDVNAVTVEIGQLVGAGLMSKHTARTKHPHIDDAEIEERQTVVEQLEQSSLTALQQQAVSGAIDPTDMVEILRLVRGGTIIEEAVVRAHQAAQARQATQAPPPGDGQAAAPEAQPGLANPTVGAPQPAPTVPPPGQGQVNLQQLIRAVSTQPRPQPPPPQAA